MGDFIQRQLFAVADVAGVIVGLWEELDYDMEIPTMDTPQYMNTNVGYGWNEAKYKRTQR